MPMEALIGAADALPDALAVVWPALTAVRWRRGGLPPRIGGWCLGHACVSGITLGRTVWLAPGVAWDAELCLHEARHVQQWAADRLFPLRYILESLRRGYQANRYEVDAREYAAQQLGAPTGSRPPLAKER